MQDEDIVHTDAIGHEIVLDSWYGYSRNDGGWSHVTVGMASKVANGKVRLIHCMVLRYLYGKPSDYRAGEKASDVTISCNMVFPVSKSQTEKFAETILTWPGE